MVSKCYYNKIVSHYFLTHDVIVGDNKHIIDTTDEQMVTCVDRDNKNIVGTIDGQTMTWADHVTAGAQ